jgi:hypothetical protein
MADCVAHETENAENKQNDANCGDDLKETVKKPETAVDETGDAVEHKGEGAAADDAEATSRKRKSEAGVEPEAESDESKKAKTCDKEVPPTNGSEAESHDQPEVTTKTVEDVKRLSGEEDQEAAA